MTLEEIRLPEGAVKGFDIAYPLASGRAKREAAWIHDGHKGVRIIGAGPNRTHLVPDGWDGATMVVDRHNGTVTLESMTIHAGGGGDRGIMFGRSNKTAPLARKFKLILRNCHVIVDPPAPGKPRVKWALFGYNSDVELEDCVIDATEAREHASYWHGFARHGATWRRVKVVGAGAEPFKVRSDALETLWPGRGQLITLEECEFQNWYQEWSDRGGAAVVLQGAQADLFVDRCVFRGGAERPYAPAHQRSRAIMVTSEANSYADFSGRVDTNGHGNGNVVVRRSAIIGGPGPEWTSPMIRVGRVGGEQWAARSVLIEACGVYGKGMSIQTSEVPDRQVRVRKCNTPGIRDYCRDTLGVPEADLVEAVIPTKDRMVPASEGIVR